MNREELLRTMGIGVGSEVAAPKPSPPKPQLLSEDSIFPKSEFPESWTPPPPSTRRNGKGSLADLGLGPVTMTFKGSPIEENKYEPGVPPGLPSVQAAVEYVRKVQADIDKSVSIDTETKQTETLEDIPIASFVTGSAGSGKTYQVKEWARKNPGGVILSSTTGISAVNLGENVVTLNSLLGYFDTASLRDAFTRGQLDSKISKLGQAGLKHLVIDECFDYKQPILTEHGWMRIGDVVKKQLEVRVWSQAPSGKLELKPVTGWHRRAYPGKLLRIDVTRGNSKRGCRLIKCTPDHKIKTAAGYVRAGDLIPGSRVTVRGPGLTEVQRGMLVGSLLGDAHMNRKKTRNSPQIVLIQGEAQLEYLKTKELILGPLAGKMRMGASGYKPGSHIYQLPVNIVDEFWDFAAEMHSRQAYGRNYWEPSDKFISWIDARALAFWFCDDGSIGRSHGACINTGYIHTPPFSPQVLEKLCAHLNLHFGIAARVEHTRRGHNRLRLAKAGITRLLEVIQPHVPAAMAYKVPGACCIYERGIPFDTCEAPVREITWTDKHLESAHVFDVTVDDNHNYIAGNVVVSNCSMMDGDQLVLIQAALDGVNESREVSGEPPITLTLTGDFLQLPPIKSKFAFEVGVWEKYEANTTRLDKIWRQSDPDFLGALAKARAGHAAAATDYFGRFCAPLLDPKFPGITLMAKNQEVDRYNQVKMLEIAAPTVEFKSETWGDARPEWKSIPIKLGLKVGALVMVLSNKKDGTDREKFLCVNGDIGTVHEFEVDKGIVWVVLQRNGMQVPVSYVQRDNTIPLEPGRAKELRALGHDNRIKDRYEIIGQVTYMPLRPSWASTTHKSQGLTLEHCQIDVRDNFYRSPGMCYVALSRVSSPAGLRIVGGHKVLQSRLNIDPRVKRWI